MTEAEWLVCEDPDRMLSHLGRKASGRKRRLFACACYRHIPSLLADERCLKAVAVSERYADGLATREELCHALTTAEHLFPRRWPSSLPTARHAEVARSLAARLSIDGVVERKYQAKVLQCLIGNPFHRPSRPSEAMLNWNDRRVLEIAMGIRDQVAFDRLPILADALEDAGCTDAAILDHLRGPGLHVRGCFALDLVLGKS